LTGGIDLLVDDEPTAIEAVRRLLSYHQDGPAGEPSSGAAAIRDTVPNEGSYDMHRVIDALADAGSVFELRPRFATPVITAFARMGGRAVGVLASQPDSYNGGAIDQRAADKIAHFVELCDAYEFPIIALVDTPGFVLRPRPDEEVEQPGMTRHHVRPLLAHHHRTVPLISVQIRRGYGLGAAAMTGIGNGRSVPALRLAWPTVELTSADGFTVREGTAFDDVVDPAETRDRIIATLRLLPRPPSREQKKRPVDTW
jgi:acetyl-CoA carboxylase carboxyltransferase component